MLEFAVGDILPSFVERFDAGKALSDVVIAVPRILPEDHDLDRPSNALIEEAINANRAIAEEGLIEYYRDE